ncbi:hypothetical protein BD310DRAFT_414593 [Dichomitus squalens]|uniref:Uncharacterized protein n=1 Tax=Dichomitus squalens TaxID=114155 RepID=A0A4Q9PY04_9APHY|nr:hypothetical protein BD310DRAFT_414593 [Dichomitus squalens]
MPRWFRLHILCLAVLFQILPPPISPITPTLSRMPSQLRIDLAWSALRAAVLAPFYLTPAFYHPLNIRICTTQHLLRHLTSPRSLGQHRSTTYLPSLRTKKASTAARLRPPREVLRWTQLCVIGKHIYASQGPKVQWYVCAISALLFDRISSPYILSLFLSPRARPCLGTFLVRPGSCTLFIFWPCFHMILALLRPTSALPSASDRPKHSTRTRTQRRSYSWVYGQYGHGTDERGRLRRARGRNNIEW